MRLSKQFRSKIFLRRGRTVADLRSILSLLSLCATMGTVLDIETTGEDEHDAARAVEQVFSTREAGNAPVTVAELKMKL